MTVDQQASDTPVVFDFLPGSHHRIDAPSPQEGPAGTQYVLSAAQEFDVKCGAPRASVTIGFDAQYSLAVSTDSGGSVTSAEAWQAAGSAVTLYATPDAGYLFTGWTGDCSGTEPCKLVMNAPRNVTAHFATAQ